MPFNELKQNSLIERKKMQILLDTFHDISALQLHELKSNDGQQYMAQLQNFQMYNFHMAWSTFQEQRTHYHIQEQPPP